MARTDEISSTERLLDLIKKGKSEPPPAPSPEQTGTVRKGSGSVVAMHKSVTVGVDMGHDALRMVKTSGSHEGKRRLLDYAVIPYRPDERPGKEGFVDFLRDELTAFCGPAKKVQLWAIMSAARVDVRNIFIPKVPKKEIENAVYWTVKKEASFDERENAFDFEVQGEVVDQGIPRYSVMAYIAPLEEIDDLRRLFSGAGFTLAGVTITPFAMQNIFRTRWFDPGPSTLASLFIGNDFSRIDIYSKGSLVMTRGIKAGANSMVESFMEEFGGRVWVQPSLPSHGPKMGSEEARRVLQALSEDSPPLSDKDPGFGLTREEVFQMIVPAVDRLSRQTERTFEYYSLNHGNDAVQKVYMSGVLNVYKPLLDHVGGQLGVETEVWDPLSLQLDQTKAPLAPLNLSERAAFVPALGAALSDNSYTPNLLFTYRDKEKMVRSTRINRVVFLVFLALVFLCGSIFSYQLFSVSQRKAALAKLEQQLADFSPRADRNVIMQMIAKGKERQATFRAARGRYLGVSVISELSSLTPASVRLTNLRMNFGSFVTAKAPEAGKEPAKVAATTGERTETIILEGFIEGERGGLEAALTAFTLKLEASPMFRQVNIQRSVVEKLRKDDVLFFIIDMKIG